MAVRGGITCACLGAVVLAAACGRSAVFEPLPPPPAASEEPAATQEAGGADAGAPPGAPASGADGLAPPPVAVAEEREEEREPPSPPDVECLPPVPGPDWSVMGGDPQRSSSAPPIPWLSASMAGPLALERRWQRRHGREAGAPTVAAGRIFALREDSLSSIPVQLGSWSLHDGSEGCGYGWVETGGNAPAHVAAEGGGRVYGWGPLGITARDGGTAELLWEQRSLRSAATLPVGDDLLVTGFEPDTHARTVARLRGADGEVLWATEMPEQGEACGLFLASADPALDRAAVSMRCVDGFADRIMLAAFELSTGALLWSQAERHLPTVPPFNGPSRATFLGLTSFSWPVGPMIVTGADGTGRVVLPMPSADLVAYDLDSGALLWSAPRLSAARLIDFERPHVEYGQYALAGGHVLYVINGVPIESDEDDPATPCPGLRYGCTEGEAIGAILVALRADSGTVTWQRELPALVSAAPVVIGEVAVLGVGDELHVIDVDAGDTVSRFELGELLEEPPPPAEPDFFIGRPAVAGGRILVQTYSRKLLALAPAP